MDKFCIFSSANSDPRHKSKCYIPEGNLTKALHLPKKKREKRLKKKEKEKERKRDHSV